MAASSGSLETSANSNSQTQQSTPHFSFSSDDYPVAAVRRGLGDRITDRTGSGVPKFKSLPPPSLPLSPPPVSPSSYFSIPPGLSPAELLDSPVLLSASNVSFLFIYLQFLRHILHHLKLKFTFLLIKYADFTISNNRDFSISSF